MNYFDILLAKKLDKGGGGEITIEGLSVTANGTYSEEGKAYTPVVVNIEGYKLEDMPTGAIATITDAAALTLNELKVAIEPVQSGSGDPSPSNVRPISGWTEANVSLNEINQWNEQWEIGGFDMNTGKKTQNNNFIRSKNFIPILPTNNYYLKIWYSIGNTGFSLLFYDKDKNFISSLKKWNPNLSTNEIPSESRYMMFKTDSIRATYKNDISINYPSTDTSYHAYNGHTYTIQLGDTYYGGKLDVVNGVLTKTHEYIASYNGETLPSTWISDRDVYASGTTPTTGAEVVYELATPTTIQLTPTQVRSLLGNNNIFADTGNIIEGQYFKTL